MSLRLILKAKSAVPLEVEGITPDIVRGKSLPRSRSWRCFRETPLAAAEFFTISGDASDGVME
jgi:hypothetical protein